MLIFGGSQAVRRFNAAVADALPRLVERGHVLHVTGDDGYAAALAGAGAAARRPAAAVPAVPVPARGHAAGPRRRGPRRRAGGVVDARRGDGPRDPVGHRPVPARRRATRRRTPGSSPRPGGARLVRGRGSSTPTPSSRRRISSPTTRPVAGWPTPLGSFGTARSGRRGRRARPRRGRAHGRCPMPPRSSACRAGRLR